MGFWQRLAAIFQAKGNKALDRFEDPRQTLDLSYEKQLDNLTKVRRSVADVATARKRIELQANALKQQGDKLQDQAKAALAQGNEPLARTALERRSVIAGQLAELETQHQQIADQEQKLIATSTQLQAEVEAFRTRKETMKASYTAAEAQTHIGEAISGISTSMGNAGAAMQRAQDKIAQMQARSGAIDELLQSGALTDLTHPVDDIQAQLDKASSATEVDSEMAKLKAELASAPAAALGGGTAEAAGEAGSSATEAPTQAPTEATTGGSEGATTS